ncbi:MAG: carbohydrate kinase family protein [Thermoflexales bacterium]|nr:carbohydrate kinase family protein [Thermoflexales bacterium]
MSIIVTGSFAFDYIMSFPGCFKDYILPEQLEHISLSFLVDEMQRVRGGCAPNIAYSLALLGERPLLMASAGCDAREYVDWLVEQGVDVSLLRQHDDIFSASFFVNTDRDQNQIASFYTGAMARARELSLRDVPAGDHIVIISPNDPVAMDKYTAECRELGLPFIYDPSQQVARVDGEELARGLECASVLIVNEYEYCVLQKKTGLDEAGLLERVSTIIVTLAEKGSRLLVDGQEILIPPARPTRPIGDPTGVGDAYRAGLLKGIVRRYPWEVTGRIAALAAVYVLESPSPQPEPYTRAEFAARYRENFGDTPALEDLVR